MDLNYHELIKFDYVYIFEYYDIPLFFILKNERNEMYLNYMIEELDDKEIKWFFAKMSKIELNNLLTREEGVKGLLTRLIEEGRMEYLFVDNINKQIYFENVDEVCIDELPLDEYFVEYDYLTKREIEIEKEIDVISNDFDLILRDHENSHCVNVDLLTKVLSKFQGVFKSIRQNESSLKVAAIYPSSFGIKLVGSDDLFVKSENILKNIMYMFDKVKRNRIEEIEKNIFVDEIYNVSTLKKVEGLLKDITKNNVTVELKVNSKQMPSVTLGKSDIKSFEEITKALKSKVPDKTEELQIRGILTSININQSKFSITEKNGKKYSGQLAETLKVNLKEKQFIVPADISATLTEISEYNFDKNEYIPKYKLLHYKQEGVEGN
ncbi:hypothetical protein [Staphylococcus simulans]|uniref:hypothetical protein n=1 Tax=Staphylococcus simulans TaxID=1286 RepID=UPI003999C943